MTSPVCTPPWAAADVKADCRARYSRSASLRCSVFTRAAGEILACHSASSASRFPTPAILDWSSRRALTAMVPFMIRSRNSAGVTSPASGPSLSTSGLSRTRPSLRLSNSARLPPSANSSVKRFHTALAGCASRRKGSPAQTSWPSGDVTTMRPPMPRWMPRSGPGAVDSPIPEVSHHSVLPRRRAAVSVRPTSASRSWPGVCGRQTNESASSTPTMRRFRACPAIRLRARSTSGSSGIHLFYRSMNSGVSQTGNRIWPSWPATVQEWPKTSVTVALAAAHGQVTGPVARPRRRTGRGDPRPRAGALGRRPAPPRTRRSGPGRASPSSSPTARRRAEAASSAKVSAAG